ncbi:CBS domain-containing protein [Azospirillaceae bacterium]
MSDAFSFAVPPFDRLTSRQRERFSASLDIGFYPKGSTIINGSAAAETLYVILKGTVEELRDGEIVAIYGPRDSFDTKALFGTVEGKTFTAAEDVICHLASRQILIDLAQENQPFGDYYSQDIAEKLRLLSRDHANREMAALTMTPVGRTMIRTPLFVEASISVRYAAVLMKTHRVTSLLVRDGDRVGILTGTDMREAVILADCR